MLWDLFCEPTRSSISHGDIQNFIDPRDNTIVVLPNLLRCQSREHLWNDYSKTTKDNDKKDRLGWSSFIEIASNITRAVSCVDYVLGNLVNDPVERL